MKMTYNEYKDSGIEWIGEIPSHWYVCKLKHTCDRITDGSHSSPSTTDVGKPYITVSDVRDGAIDVENSHRISLQDFGKLVSSGCQPRVGDVLLAKDGTVGRTAIVSENDFVVLSSLGIISPQNKITSKFLKYSLDSSLLQEQMNMAMAGSALRRITIEKIKELLVIIPPLDEQQAIASYLDEKCEKIDTLVNELEKQIEDLGQLKKSEISRVVTKGLNPNAPLKDSGIEWIGQTPEGWTTHRLKHEFSMGKGLPITKDDLKDTGLPVVSYGQIHAKSNSGLIIAQELIRFVDKSFLNSNTQSIVPKGGFIFADTSEDVEGSGNCIYQDRDETIFAGYHTIILFPRKNFNNKYLAYLFQENSWRSQIRSRVYGTKVMSITKAILEECTIISPPPDEQRSIVSYLDTFCAKIDATTSEIEKQIEDLKAYKQSVISEAVTGKIRVTEQN